MSTVQDSLRNYIETTLNDNTQDIKFRIFIYETKENDDNSNDVLKENSYYQTEEEAFIPGVLVDFDGDKVPILGSQLIDYTIPLVLRVNTDGNLTSIDDIFSSATLDGFKIAMEEFSTKLTGNSETIDGINYVFNTDILTPIGGIDEETGYNYVNFGINIFANSGDVYFGNDVTYKIGNTIGGISLTSLTPFDRVHSRAYNSNTIQKLNNTYAESIIDDNIWSGTFSFYYNKLEILSKIIKQIETNDYSQNNKYEFETTIPLYDDTNLVTTRDVLIQSGSFSPDLGEKIVITVTFIEIDESL